MAIIANLNQILKYIKNHEVALSLIGATSLVLGILLAFSWPVLTK